MEHLEEKKQLFPVFYDISREVLDEASESLEKKGKNALMNFIHDRHIIDVLVEKELIGYD